MPEQTGDVSNADKQQAASTPEHAAYGEIPLNPEQTHALGLVLATRLRQPLHEISEALPTIDPEFRDDLITADKRIRYLLGQLVQNRTLALKVDRSWYDFSLPTQEAEEFDKAPVDIDALAEEKLPEGSIVIPSTVTFQLGQALAHRFNQPINLLYGYSQMLENQQMKAATEAVSNTLKPLFMRENQQPRSIELFTNSQGQTSMRISS